MKGSPIVRTLVAWVGLVLVGVLLFQMTNADGDSVQGATSSVEVVELSGAVPTMIRIRASHQPGSLVLSHGSEVIAEYKTPQELEALEWEIDSHIADPEQGVELVLTALWADGQENAAVTVELEPDGLETKSQTEWCVGGELSATLFFRWR